MIDRLLDLTAAIAPAFAKSGARLYHLADDSGQMQIWSLDLADGARRQLTFLDEPVGFFARSPADDTILFGVDRGGDERQQLHLLRPGAAPEALTAAPDAIHGWGAFAPDGGCIAYTANTRNGVDFDLFIHDLASGEARCLAELDGQRKVLAWSPDGTGLALLTDRSHADQDLALVEIPTGAIRPIERRHGLARYAALRWRKDGTAAYVLTELGGEYMGVARLDPATGALDGVFACDDGDAEALALSPDATRLAIAVNRAGWSDLLLVDLGDGAATRIERPAGVIGEIAWSPDGASIVFSQTDPTRPRGLWRLDVAGGQVAPLLAVEAPDLVLRPWNLARFESFDGLEIQAWLALPAGPPPEGGRKAVVWVHGGPESQVRPTYRPDIQAMLAEGYAVLLPNVRGSTGYGRRFASLDDVRLRLDAVEDLRRARLWLGARADIDDGAIAVMGQSYGGFMVLATLTRHPELWKAGIEYYGIVHFLSLLRDTGRWRWRHRAVEYGDPVRDRDFLHEISPLTLIDRLRVPLLVAHGRRDPRVPFSETESLLAALAAHGHEVETVLFDHEGHGFTRPEDKRRILGTVMAFLDARL
ncbi:MAG TPA: S9 family peptidase [Aliidongia sp.]|uniref:S9 family peptidase n=1 Tax=Aliidongia sp. TaxID=1914230 RepID=UPI002DDD2455|nr:S9 family peptidase [Aliidongia sp.]HEV2673643.1 S9 family peptidase [Aliidongia sp.]